MRGKEAKARAQMKFMRKALAHVEFVRKVLARNLYAKF